MKKMGLKADWGENLVFPTGSFFWAKTAAMRPWFELGFDWEDYPEEPLANGGTLLHALERLLFFVAQETGYSIATTQVPGVTR